MKGKLTWGVLVCSAVMLCSGGTCASMPACFGWQTWTKHDKACMHDPLIRPSAMPACAVALVRWVQVGHCFWATDKEESESKLEELTDEAKQEYR
jgi:hypothetical protein